MNPSIFISRITSLALFVCLSFTMVGQGISLNARAYLQGSLINSFETGETNGRPLMRDNLRFNPYNSQRVIPDQDIYQIPYIVNAYTTVDVTNSFTHVGCGTLSQYQTIPNTFSVFAVTGENAIVDWVFVELRDKNDYTSIVATRSGLIQRDGDIVDLDGTSSLFFNFVNPDSYFVVIRHRNHLGVMTKYPITSDAMADLVDFTVFETDVFDFGNTSNQVNYSGLAQKVMTVSNTEVRALWGGDFDCDGVICYHGDISDLNILQKEVAGFDLNLNPDYQVNFNAAIGYLQGDFDMDGKSKFTAPNDDKNWVLDQVVFYPMNAEARTNFVQMAQQIPE